MTSLILTQLAETEGLKKTYLESNSLERMEHHILCINSLQSSQ